MKKYEIIAEDIASAIQQGLLKRGDKLPSIRQTQTSKQVNASTVFQAYYLLEARGLIVTRPRSGYYVAGPLGSERLLPHTASDDGTPTTLQVSDLVFNLLERIKDPQQIPFGSAFPSPLLFPLAKLADHMASAVRRMQPQETVSDIGQGDIELRRQIALRYQLDGKHTEPSDIVITNGALEALNLCLAAVTQPGDSVIIESPSFYAALQAIERMGLRAIEVPSHPEHGIDLAALERAIIQHRPKACWLMTNFQNPTGSLMPSDKKQALVALITRYQLPMIEDDVYRELYFGKERPLPANTWDSDGWVMHCSSFSKALAPGYRVGWVSAGRFAEKITRLKISTTLATSIPAQLALASYLAKGGYDKHLRQLRHQLMLQQLQFSQAIHQHLPPQIRFTLPQGGYFLWLQLPGQQDGLQLFQQANAENISLAPGHMFSSQQQYASYIRLNYGHAMHHVHLQAIARLGQLMKSPSKPRI
ncbi:PLP-dependent aminotransferase family protein [Methylophilus sp.]|uniref:aminotransferase-like domain-containing protein n=1 Tax=Methylophilus sp. TaxID=29541 RepID=UPI0011DB3F0A|nr:PLP-dependent aminotransferase family protein [Methylophilus sp.]TXI45658.1 MAG: PLP-dependent aminotransferase family protein [Methylophilus sp.]